MTEVKTAHVWKVGDKATHDNGHCVRAVTIAAVDEGRILVHTDEILSGAPGRYALVGVTWRAAALYLTPIVPEPTDPELAAQALKVLTDGGVNLDEVHGGAIPAAARALQSVILKAEKRAALIAEAQALHSGYRISGGKDWDELSAEKQDRWIRAVKEGRAHRNQVKQATP